MKNHYIWLFIVFATLFSGCKENYSPKPKGYYRIDFPVKEYVSYQGNCAFRFEHPKRSIIDTKSKSLREKCWFNLHYPQYNCTIHLSYFDIQGDTLYNFIEEARTLAMKHIVKANQIKETEIARSNKDQIQLELPGQQQKQNVGSKQNNGNCQHQETTEIAWSQNSAMRCLLALLCSALLCLLSSACLALLA